LRSTALVGQMTLISRVLGLVRDATIAAIFGASAATDAFFVAFKIPNLFRRLFAEGAFSQAFVPVLAAYKATASPDEVRRLLDAVFSRLALVLLGLTAAGILAAPVVISVFAPGFVGDPARFDLSVELLRLTFPYLLFIALTALLSGLLNTYGRFALPAVTPALLNLSFIGCTLWLAPHLAQPVHALGAAVLVGGALQLSLQVVAAWRMGFLPRFTRDRKSVV
jgi:putative peptidoglycan lipid II flippase